MCGMARFRVEWGLIGLFLAPVLPVFFSYCWYGSVEGCVCFMEVLHLCGLCWEKYVICVHVEGYKNGERDVICKEDIANHDV